MNTNNTASSLFTVMICWLWFIYIVNEYYNQICFINFTNSKTFRYNLFNCIIPCTYREAWWRRLADDWEGHSAWICWALAVAAAAGRRVRLEAADWLLGHTALVAFLLWNICTVRGNIYYVRWALAVTVAAGMLARQEAADWLLGRRTLVAVLQFIN